MREGGEDMTIPVVETVEGFTEEQLKAWQEEAEKGYDLSTAVPVDNPHLHDGENTD
ncbi:MAG: hypothetical protein Q4G30_10610 [Actinomycetaceae bacterium]|nr:hypothetical protein [Actinomycetaceae bacterium]